MSGAALAIAIVGLLLGIANSVVGYLMWHRSGPVVRVHSTFAFPVFGASLGEQHVQVNAVNKGRAAAPVSGWGIRLLPALEDVVMFDDQPPPGCRIEAHGSMSWRMAVAALEAEAAQRPGCRPTPWVRLGDGTEILAKEPVKLGQ